MVYIKTKEGASLWIALLATAIVAGTMTLLDAVWWVTLCVCGAVFVVVALVALFIIRKYVAYKLKPIYSIVLSRDVHTHEIFSELKDKHVENIGEELTAWADTNDKEIARLKETEQFRKQYQRSVYIKECARIMDIDENILISEVARKRMATTGDREADEFVRRQTALRKAEAPQPEVEFVKQVEAGSSTEALERELVKYLLKYGHCSFEFKEGRTMVACNVAEVIFLELDSDGLTFRNPLYNSILATYREQWKILGTGVEVPAHFFLNHPDPEVCNASVDILTSDDNYVASQLWRRKDIHVESDAEMLAVGVPKAVTLYKSKVIESYI